MKFDAIKGKTLINIAIGEDSIIFIDSDNKKYALYHDQDCCESVYIEDIIGDLSDLLGEPLLIAEERSQRDDTYNDDYDSSTWTFYELATIKGNVTIRWLGASNGYYSEEVDFKEL